MVENFLSHLSYYCFIVLNDVSYFISGKRLLFVWTCDGTLTSTTTCCGNIFYYFEFCNFWPTNFLYRKFALVVTLVFCHNFSAKLLKCFYPPADLAVVNWQHRFSLLLAVVSSLTIFWFDDIRLFHWRSIIFIWDTCMISSRESLKALLAIEISHWLSFHRFERCNLAIIGR